MNTLESEARQRRVQEAGRNHRRFLLFVLALVIVGMWLLPITSSLWLDETGTADIVDRRFGEMVRLTFTTQGQVPYYVLVWLTRRVLGASEAALRLPSLLAASAAAFLLSTLTRRLLDRETGLIAAIAFASLGGVAFAAADARPYALGLAALIGSTLALVRWIDAPRFTRGLLYVFLVALTVYIHYLFAAGLLFHPVYVFMRRRAGAAVTARMLAGPLTLLPLLLAPATVQILALYGRREVHSFPINLETTEVLRFLAPSTFVAALLAGLVFARLAGGFSVETAKASDAPATLALVIGWLALPPVVLYVASQLTSASVFSDRYVLSSAPGLALAAGWAIRSISSIAGRQVATVTLAAVAILAEGTLSHAREDWRGAAAAVNAAVDDASTPLLVHAAFSEAQNPAWLTDPELAERLVSPLVVYPVEGRLLPMPYSLDENGVAYLVTITEDTLLKSGRFVLVTRFPTVPFRAWLDGRLGQAGFSSRSLGDFGRLGVFLFERGPTG